MHYERNGTEIQDKSSFGFWFAPGPPAMEILKTPITAGVVTAAGKTVLDGASAPDGPTLRTKVYYPTVPANTAQFEVVSVQPITTPITIYELMPHAHNRATDFKYTVVFPDGREQVLLAETKHDHSRQFANRFATPRNVPA